MARNSKQVVGGGKQVVAAGLDPQAVQANGGAVVVCGGLTLVVRGGTKVVPAGDPKRNGVTVGLTTGLNLTGWYNAALDAVAAYGVAYPGDDAIMAALLAEYPKHVTSSGKPQQPVAAYVGYYNGARHGLGGPGLHVARPKVGRTIAPPPAPPKAPAAKQAPVKGSAS